MSKKAFVFFSECYSCHNLAFVAHADSLEEVVKILEGKWVVTTLRGNNYTTKVLSVSVGILQKYNLYRGEDSDIFSVQQAPLLDINLQ